VLGLFQIGAMNELSIRLKQAAALLSDQGARKHLRVNQVIISLMALVYITVGYFEYVNFVELIDNWSDLGPPPKRLKAYNWITPSVLLSISLGLTVSVAYLFVQIHRHFNRQVMMAEAARVRTIFLVFILTYISRAIIYLIQMVYIKKPANTALVYYVFYNIWDVVPLMLIMHYHYTCYEAQETTENERDPAGTIVSVASTELISETVT